MYFVQSEREEGAGLSFPRLGPIHLEVLFLMNIPTNIHFIYPPLLTRVF